MNDLQNKNLEIQLKQLLINKIIIAVQVYPEPECVCRITTNDNKIFSLHATDMGAWIVEQKQRKNNMTKKKTVKKVRKTTKKTALKVKKVATTKKASTKAKMQGGTVVLEGEQDQVKTAPKEKAKNPNKAKTQGGAVVIEGQKDTEANVKAKSKSKVIIKDGVVSVDTQNDD